MKLDLEHSKQVILYGNYDSREASGVIRTLDAAIKLVDENEALKASLEVRDEVVSRMTEALELIWLGDWSAVSGSDTASQYAKEALDKFADPDPCKAPSGETK